MSKLDERIAYYQAQFEELKEKTIQELQKADYLTIAVYGASTEKLVLCAAELKGLISAKEITD